MVEHDSFGIGRLDAACNNAGCRVSPFETAEAIVKSSTKVNAINLRSVSYMKVRMPPNAQTRKLGIVNNSYIGGTIAYRPAIYHATKQRR